MFALPALEALRAPSPAAEIRLIGDPWQADLVVGRPAGEGGPTLVDRQVPLSARAAAWLSGRGAPDDGREAEAIARDVAPSRPDLAIQLHGGGRPPQPFVASPGARPSVGPPTPPAGCPFRF